MNDKKKQYSGVFGYNVLDNNTVEITDYIGRESTVIIPDEINELKVSQIGRGAFSTNDSQKTIQKVILGSSVQRICADAFAGCNFLHRIEIPESVLEIEPFAFWDCASLESIWLPDSLEEIGEYAFSGCKSLSNIRLPETLTRINHCVFYECSSLDSIVLPSALLSIGQGAFSNCTSLAVVLRTSEELAVIEDTAFYNCSSLIDVGFLYGVISIGKSAFEKCTSLTEIVFPETLGIISEDAFKNCAALQRIWLGFGMSEIADGAFSECENLYQISLDPDNYDFAIVDGVLFHKDTHKLICMPAGCNIESYAVPRRTTAIAGKAFAGCSNLKHLFIPETVNDFTAYSLFGCDTIKTIDIAPGHLSLKNIGGVIFDISKQMLVYYPHTNTSNTYSVPIGITSIGEWAFCKNQSLTTVILPDTIIEIGRRAFSNCTKLKTCILPDSLYKLGEYTFNACSLLSNIHIPPKVTIIPMGSFAGCSSLKSVSLPDSVNVIGQYAFMLCSSLVDVILPNSLTEIHGMAFSFCQSLRKLLLPRCISVIEPDAFSVNSALSIEVYENSYAKNFAIEHNLTYAIVDDSPVVEETTNSPDISKFKELFELTGLYEIKKEVRSLIEFVSMQKMRIEQGLKATPVSLHMVFTGNPGTGKTAVARIIAKLYKEIGVLEKGQLVEVDRSGLVAGYVGQTAIKTQEKINEAKGGILFIDEAYTLIKDGHDYGQEAIDTILKAMEDNRDSFIVIVAGYHEPMRKFINSNQGLKSRFNKYFDFPDYTLDELVQIFLSFCEKNDYKLSSSAESAVRKYISKTLSSKDENFANARDIRNYFESAIQKQAVRLSRKGARDREELMLLIDEDLI